MLKSREQTLKKMWKTSGLLAGGWGRVFASYHSSRMTEHVSASWCLGQTALWAKDTCLPHALSIDTKSTSNKLFETLKKCCKLCLSSFRKDFLIITFIFVEWISDLQVLFMKQLFCMVAGKTRSACCGRNGVGIAHPLEETDLDVSISNLFCFIMDMHAKFCLFQGFVIYLFWLETFCTKHSNKCFAFLPGVIVVNSCEAKVLLV